MPPKSILITGCSSNGIGSSLATAFHHRNLTVFATARDPAKMSHLRTIPTITLLTLDPTVPSSVLAALQIVEAQTGGTLDILVNNAGQTFTMPMLDVDIETAKSMYEINIWGLLRVTQAFAPLVIAAKGSIVNISSVAASLNTPWIGLYTGSKAAVTAISETLRLELAPFDVKVVTVQTGAVGTNTFAAGAQFKLPEASRYRGIEKEIAARAKGEDGVPKMESSVFAEKIVGDVLGGAGLEREDSMLVKGTGLDVMKV